MIISYTLKTQPSTVPYRLEGLGFCVIYDGKFNGRIE